MPRFLGIGRGSHRLEDAWEGQRSLGPSSLIAPSRTSCSQSSVKDSINSRDYLKDEERAKLAFTVSVQREQIHSGRFEIK